MSLNFVVNALRLTRVELNQFKNVTHGEVVLERAKRSMGGSMLALYGQNGSGKTALIDAIELLKFVLSGRAIPTRFAHLIETTKTTAMLAFDFLLETDDGAVSLFYEFSVSRDADEEGSDRIKVIGEKLAWSYALEDKSIRKTKIIDTYDSEKAFTPTVRLATLAKGVRAQDTLKNEISLLLKRQSLNEAGKSFVFSDDLLAATVEVSPNSTSDWQLIGALLERMKKFAREELFVISSRESSLIALDALILAFNLETPNHSLHGKMPVNLTSHLIPVDLLPWLKESISNSNLVLGKLVPGLSIDVKELAPGVFENGVPGIYIQLLSRRKGQEVCLQYESDGIKKIFSILHLLIAVYNKRTITVAIDEIDSGIFEYLLGELLNLLSEKAKGQIIFTSHNLRPLEMIDRRFIVFTTTNKTNRYSRLQNIKNTNNLRDVYYREVSLGDGEFYEHTNAIEIAHAFKSAWKRNG